jgi:hypothetical protein
VAALLEAAVRAEVAVPAGVAAFLDPVALFEAALLEAAPLFETAGRDLGVDKGLLSESRRREGPAETCSSEPLGTAATYRTVGART